MRTASARIRLLAAAATPRAHHQARDGRERNDTDQCIRFERARSTLRVVVGLAVADSYCQEHGLVRKRWRDDVQTVESPVRLQPSHGYRHAAARRPLPG